MQKEAWVGQGWVDGEERGRGGGEGRGEAGGGGAVAGDKPRAGDSTFTEWLLCKPDGSLHRRPRDPECETSSDHTSQEVKTPFSLWGGQTQGLFSLLG